MQEGLQLGQIVRVKAGHDKKLFMVVVKIADEGYVLLADGKTRTVEKPKRKKDKHIAPTKHVAKEIAGLIQTDQALTDAQIKSAIKDFTGRNREEVD